jgi:hypothetical protein
MAKANVSTNTNTGIIDSALNLITALFVATRIVKNQTLKAEQIIDIASDAALHSAQWVDTHTRANLEAAKSQAKLN